MVLKTSQIAALVEPALQNSSTACPSAAAASTAANATALYTGGQMAGLGCGLGLPLGLALLFLVYLLRQERAKHAGPKLMYKLPDNHDDFTIRSNLRTNSHLSLSSHTVGGAYSNQSSRRNSIGTIGSGKPIHLQTFAQHYDMLKYKGASVNEIDLGRQRHELDGSGASAPPYPEEVHWHELDAKRMSK